MCGRYALRNREVALRWAGIASAPDDPALARPRYNVAPTQRVLAITNDPAAPAPRAEYLRWGLVPSWSRSLKGGPLLINARSETITTAAPFRAAWKTRRAVVLADGFIEWRKGADGSKQPVLFELASGGPFAFAGLWEDWSPRPGEEGEPVRSCTVATCAPNDLVRQVHDRMPVILATPADVDGWLHSAGDLAKAAAMLRPLPAELMRAGDVSPMVSNARNDSPECLAPKAAV